MARNIIARTPMKTLDATDTIQEAFEELSILKVVEPIDADLLRVDQSRLAALGYTLILWTNEVTFCKTSDIQRYLYNPVIYMDNVIPRTALKSYTLIRIKEDYSSF